jgi:small subunit ribosomal protein S20
MAHSISAEKRIRQNLKRRERNRAVMSDLRSQLKRTMTAIESGDKAKALAALALAAKKLDKAAKTHTIHRNEASRRKSRLATKIARLK